MTVVGASDCQRNFYRTIYDFVKFTITHAHCVGRAVIAIEEMLV
jgi:hypothetical protein